MSWFANVGNRRRYEIPEINGWIELRNELTVGEEREMFSNAIHGRTQLDDGKVRIDYDAKKLTFGKVLAYLHAWSEKQDITPAQVQALKPEVFAEIEKIVERHVTELEKNETAAETTAPTLSVVGTSPSAA